jgi:hypothetical protein
MPAVVASLKCEVKGGFDLPVLEGGTAFGERIFFENDRPEEFGFSLRPGGSLLEQGIALAPAQQQWEPLNEGSHRRIYGELGRAVEPCGGAKNSRGVDVATDKMGRRFCAAKNSTRGK